VTDFHIDKRVKLPPATNFDASERIKYPFRGLQVGDSFFIPKKTREGGGSLVRYWNMNLSPKMFTLRTVTEKRIPGIRIWRIA
jgi:hypothetical protein